MYRTGLRIVCRKSVLDDVRKTVVSFAKWLRYEYEFPVKVVVYLSPEKYLYNDKHCSSVFFRPVDKTTEPYIVVATGDYQRMCYEGYSQVDALCNILNTIVKRVLDYQNWYFEHGWSDKAISTKSTPIVVDYMNDIKWNVCCSIMDNFFSVLYKKKIAFNLYKKGAELFEGINENNKETGFKYILQAAEYGYDVAQEFVADCYFNGEGTKENMGTAFYWYRKSVLQGNIIAQFSLGYCYFNGYGIRQNIKSGMKWLNTAISNGNIEAQFYLAKAYYYGDNIRKNYKNAFSFFKELVNAGYSDAICFLAVCYFNGTGCEKDCSLALELYKKAASNGDSRAMYNLGLMYSDGEGVNQSDRWAHYWFEKAYNHGERNAKQMLDQMAS